jgi:four helix bundle protein
MTVKRFEDLECWQEARELTRRIYKIIKRQDFAKDFRLRDQITGAAISVMNNIAEGFDSSSDAEFVRFLSYARRSVSEVQNCLYIALDEDYIQDSDFNTIQEQAIKTRKIIDGFRRYLKA